MHFNGQDAAALAGFTAAALNIKAETPGSVAAHFGVLGVGEQAADIPEHAGVGGRVGARRAANGRLVNANDLIDPLHALNFLALAGTAAGTVQGCRQRLVQNFIDKRRFSGAGHAGDADHLAQRKIYCDILQVVLACLDDAQELSVSLAPGGGNLNKFAARQVRAGDAALCLADIRYTASRDDLTAVDARTGANIDDIVCLTHRVLVVLHDNQGVAQVAQALHRGNQLVVVTLV